MQADFWDSTIFLGDAGAENVGAQSRGEGHGSEPSRRVSSEVLLPQGWPGAWLVFVIALCGFVLLEALHVHFA